MRVQQRENLTTESINKSTCSHVIKAFNSHACGSSKRETRQGCAEVGIALPFHMLSLWSTFCFWLYYAILVLEKITVNDIRMGSIRRRFTFFMRRCSWKSSSWSLWRLLIGWKWHCKMRERHLNVAWWWRLRNLLWGLGEMSNEYFPSLCVKNCCFIFLR